MSVIQFFIFVFCSHTPPSTETIPPSGSPRISISAVPSDIRNSAVNTFRWNQQTSETSVIERVWGDPHQDKSHRMTGCQMAILLNMGGSCSVCVPLYITKRSEAVLQWGEKKKYQKNVERNVLNVIDYLYNYTKIKKYTDFLSNIIDV